MKPSTWAWLTGKAASRWAASSSRSEPRRGRFDASLVTIADNDFSHGEFNFNISGYITNENAAFALITVIRTNGSSGGVSVDYLTRPGLVAPATTNADFGPVRGTLSFSSGQTTRTFQVPIVNDELVEFDETITLVLTNATGGAQLPGGTPTSVATATLTIVDNDFLQGRLNFAQAGFTNNENDTVATILVTRTGGNVGAMTVQVRTSNGTATNPADYTGVTNTLSWADGDSSAKSFTVPLATDGIVEGPETVNLILYNPAEIGELDVRRLTSVQLDEALVPPVGGERVDLHQRVGDRGLNLGVGHDQPAEPEPVGADAAVEVAIPGEIGALDPAHRQAHRGWRRRRERWARHLEVGHHRGDLAGRQIVIAILVEQHGRTLVL